MQKAVSFSGVHSNIGAHHYMSHKHLHRYVNEFAGRLNLHKMGLGALAMMEYMVRDNGRKAAHVPNPDRRIAAWTGFEPAPSGR